MRIYNGRLGNEKYWCGRVEMVIECTGIIVIGGQTITEIWGLARRQGGQTMCLGQSAFPNEETMVHGFFTTIDSRDSEPTGKEEWRNDTMSVDGLVLLPYVTVQSVRAREYFPAVRFGDMPTNSLLIHFQTTLYPLTLEHRLVIAKDPTGKVDQNQYDSGIRITNMQYSVDHGSKDTDAYDVSFSEVHREQFSGDEDTTNIIKHRPAAPVRRPAALVVQFMVGYTGRLHQNQYDSDIWITNMQHGRKDTHLNDAYDAIFSEMHGERCSGDGDTTNIIKRRPAAPVVQFMAGYTGNLHQNQYDSDIWITNTHLAELSLASRIRSMEVYG
ncbi:hypothetical protein EDD15DRAFT_2521613 [Pisolithus albus]|nr:hypothetical protein EDD15DRAFT_2521613 [Pisolithus albus]